MNDVATNSSRTNGWLIWGAVNACLAVVCGAFAAHGLDKFVVEAYVDVEAKTVAGHEIPASFKYLQDFKTAAEYQMHHALGLLAVGLLSLRGRKRSLQTAGWSFLIGILLFSGSLYLLVLTKTFWLGAVTPIGGTLFLVGWVALALACRNAPASSPSP